KVRSQVNIRVREQLAEVVAQCNSAYLEVGRIKVSERRPIFRVVVASDTVGIGVPGVRVFRRPPVDVHVAVASRQQVEVTTRSVDRAVEDTSPLENTYSAQVKSSVRYTGAEAPLKIRIQANNLPVFRSNRPSRRTVRVVRPGILNFDHPHISSRFEDIAMRIFFLPEANALVVVYHVDWMADKPPVGFVSFRT